MVAPLITRGYEDPQRTIEINGQGILTGVFYNVTDGALAGMKMYVASDIAKEKEMVASSVTSCTIGMLKREYNMILC
jgi:hypothetical protein